MEKADKLRLEKKLEKTLIKLNRKHRKAFIALEAVNSAIDDVWGAAELLLRKEIVDEKVIL